MGSLPVLAHIKKSYLTLEKILADEVAEQYL